MSNEYSENKTDTEEETAPDYVVDMEAKVCQQVMTEWERGRQYVSDLDDLYEDLYKMVRGERPEKNYDWQSNVVINKVFQVIWTAIPYISQKIFGATPVVGVKSFDKKGAFHRETLLEFWHNMQSPANSSHVPFFLVTVMWLLRGLLNGVGVVKKTWQQELKTYSKKIPTVVPMSMDESGQEIDSEPYEKTVRYTVPVQDWPVNVVVNNKDIVFDWLLEPSQSIRHGRFVIHRAMMDLDSLKRSKINYINLDLVEAGLSSSNSSVRQDRSNLTGKDGQEHVPDSEIYTDIEVYERVGKYPVYKTKHDGEWIPCLDPEEMYGDEAAMKDMIISVVKGSGKDHILIRFEPNPYGEINYIDMHIYFDSERWNSLGMIEPIKDLQTAINDNINAMFDEIWQNLFSPVIVNKYALWDWDTMIHAPHQRWLVGGSPAESVQFMPQQQVTHDAWQKHLLLDSEVQRMAVSDSIQGMGAAKTATTNVMNAQMTAGKLDFIVKMIEQTALVPSAQMDMRFAKKFAHPITLQTIIGKPFRFGDFDEIYRYVPAASSVKLELQKQQETMEDIQMLQVIGQIQNPNVPKIQNNILANIFRNRGWAEEAELLDTSYYEPKSEAGNLQMVDRMMGNKPSNEQGISMSGTEKGVREGMFSRPKLLAGGT